MISRAAILLFDECLPTGSVARIEEFVNSNTGPPVKIVHLLDVAPSGIYDEKWVPRLKNDGYTVISADGGRRPNKNRGKKLPQLCAEYGLTLIQLSPVVHNRKVFDKARTIISVWDGIVEIAGDAERVGRRYMLEPLNMDNVGVGRLVERISRPR